MTGFSSPIFGLSWEPPTPDITIARRIITYLEDRRVLYEPYEVEVPERCIESITRIRDFLTSVLGEQAMGKDLEESLRNMRRACRKFAAAIEIRKGTLIGRPTGILDSESGTFTLMPPQGIPMNDLEFNQALGELRGGFGIHLGLLAIKYGLDIEDGLASILPVEDI